MAEFATPQRFMSIREYFELEETSPVKHEYVGGMVYAQAGASDRHNRLAGKIYRRLADAAEGTPCRVYMSDMRLFVSESAFYYPDVMVVCEPPESENPTFRRDPCLIVEVISPGTARIDRREKLLAYREIPTLNSYLIAAQDKATIERYLRDENGEWRRDELVSGDSFSVPCPTGAELSLDDLYAGL